MPKKKTQQDKLVEFIGDDVLSGEACMVAAAINLVESGDVFKKTQDPEGLLRVAAAWYDMGRALLGIGDSEEDPRPFGFGIVELADGDKNGEDESESGAKVRKELGKLRKRTR